MIDIEAIGWGVRLAAGYVVTANVPYVAGHDFARLDVYQPCEDGIPFNPCQTPKPALVFIHGGGWADGASKETYALWFLPFLQLGWIVVNVEYRPAGAAPAPAALADCLSALHWIGGNASSYNIDLDQLVIAGPSAGGHLALMVAGLATDPRAAGRIFAADSPLSPGSYPRPRAVLSWCGIVDLLELTAGPARQEFAVQWLGGADRSTFAQELSPLHHVRAGGVPVISIHGDRDLIVPYAQTARFHDALTHAGILNDLVCLQGSGHAFSAAASLQAYPRIFDFLSRVGVKPQPK